MIENKLSYNLDVIRFISLFSENKTFEVDGIYGLGLGL